MRGSERKGHSLCGAVGRCNEKLFHGGCWCHGDLQRPPCQQACLHAVTHSARPAWHHGARRHWHAQRVVKRFTGSDLGRGALEHPSRNPTPARSASRVSSARLKKKLGIIGNAAHTISRVAKQERTHSATAHGIWDRAAATGPHRPPVTPDAPAEGRKTEGKALTRGTRFANSKKCASSTIRCPERCFVVSCTLCVNDCFLGQAFGGDGVSSTNSATHAPQLGTDSAISWL